MTASAGPVGVVIGVRGGGPRVHSEEASESAGVEVAVGELRRREEKVAIGEGGRRCRLTGRGTSSSHQQRARSNEAPWATDAIRTSSARRSKDIIVP